MPFQRSPEPMRPPHRSCFLAIPFLATAPMTVSGKSSPHQPECHQSAEGEGQGQRREVSTCDEYRRRLDDDIDLTSDRVHNVARQSTGAPIIAVVHVVPITVILTARATEIIRKLVEGSKGAFV